MRLASRWFIRLLAVLVLLAGLLVAPPGRAWACSCVPPPGPDVALTQAEAVFSGRVTAIVNRGGFNLIDRVRMFFGLPPVSYGMDSRVVTLDVLDSWKGVTKTPVTIVTGSGSADCGYGFNPGGQYLVYAFDNQGRLGTNICLRTAELSQAPADLAYLQSQPALTVTPVGAALPLWCLAGAALLLGLLAVAATAARAWRRRRPTPA